MWLVLTSKILASKSILRRDDDFTTNDAGRRGLLVILCEFDVKTRRAIAPPRNFLLAELGDTESEARNFATGCVFVNHAALRCSHDHRLRLLERGRGRLAVATGDRFLDFADRIAQQRAAHLVDFGLARDLACGFACGTGICHEPLVGDASRRKRPPKRPFFARKNEGGDKARRHGEAYSNTPRGRQRLERP